MFYIESISNRVLTVRADSISNIVINDDVGLAVHEAFDNIVLAKRLLANNDLQNATVTAKAAFAASERAFYDPSMLALLYFPDDQKYAIYIPLFLPVMVPVFFSIIEIYKGLFVKKKDEEELEDSEEVKVKDGKEGDCEESDKEDGASSDSRPKTE